MASVTAFPRNPLLLPYFAIASFLKFVSTSAFTDIVIVFDMNVFNYLHI